MPYSYEPPDFLQNQSAGEIHARMLAALPPGIDTSEASVAWDFTRPAAIEKAEFVESELNKTIQIMFVLWAYGRWLDYHGQMWSVTRRPPNRSFGYLTITARYGTVIRNGFQFATVSNLTPSILFEAIDDFVFKDPGIVGDTPQTITMLVPAEAVNGGLIGNVPIDTIKLMVIPDANISFITNDTPFTGGTETEEDDPYRERILEAIRFGISYAGCDSDYIRWAKEIPAVGNVVVDPEWDDPNLPENFMWLDGSGSRRKAGAVRIFIVDSNGIPANIHILEDVYNHIIRPDNRLERLALIGAALTVESPEPLPVDIAADVILKEGQDIVTVTQNFKENLNKYWLSAATEYSTQDVQNGISQNEVKYVFIGAVLANTEGIHDYIHESLIINGDKKNLVIGIGVFPVTGEVTLNVIV